MKKSGLLIPLTTGLAVCLLFGLMTGYGRLLVWFFLPGLQGILLGSVGAFTMGAVMATRGIVISSFRHRLAIVAAMVVLFYGGQLIVPAFVLDGWDPLFLIGAILDGHFREVFTGASINSFTVQQGPLTPGRWIFMQGLDTLFFAAFALIGLGVGLDKQRSRYRVWKPAGIVGALVLFVLATTIPTQSFTSGLLRDWHVTYGGGVDYLAWRETWINASLKESGVKQFLKDTERVDLAVIPQVGVLRALGLTRLGQLDAAAQELTRSIESAKAYPGPIRIDMTRKIRVSTFIEVASGMKDKVDAYAQQGHDSVANKIPAPQPGDLFPYQGLLE